MTNMRNRIKRFHPEEEEKQLVEVASNQRIIEQAISNFPPNSKRVKRITNSIATLIAKDLRPYSVALWCAPLAFQYIVQQLFAQRVEMQVVWSSIALGYAACHP